MAFPADQRITLISAGPQKPQNLTTLKTNYEKIGPNILIPNVEKWIFWCPTISRNLIFLNT